MASHPPSPVGHLALYRRWRAQTFAQMVGQRAVVETLRNAVRLERLGHGLLFVGPRGTGKTSTARIVAKAVNCLGAGGGEPCDACASCVAIRDGSALDVVELDAASNNRVDDMRELLPRVYTAAADLRRKVFIIDEVQRIKEGWDVLLKTLEEPPDHVLFIFCTTNPAGIRPAVVSRLQRFSFRPLTPAEIRGKLVRILEAEERHADPAALELIASLAAGGMRDAESMLDQLLNSTDEELRAEGVRELLGLAETDDLDLFLTALLRAEPLVGIAVLDRLEANGRDLVAFADQLVSHLRGLILDRLAGRPAETGALSTATPAELARAARRLTGLDAHRSTAGGYRFQLELVLFRSDSQPSGQAHWPAVPEPALARPAIQRQVAQVPAEASVAAEAGAAAEASAPPSAAPTAPSPVVSSPALLAPAGTALVASDGGADDPLERLRAGWPQVVAQVGGNPAYRPLVAACRPIEVGEGIVVLGFPEDQPFLRDRSEQKRAVFEDAIRGVMGRAYGVRCVATNLEALAPLPAEGESLDLVEQARRIFEGDVVDIAEIS